MTGHRPFRELFEKLPMESRRRIKARAAATLAKIAAAESVGRLPSDEQPKRAAPKRQRRETARTGGT